MRRPGSNHRPSQTGFRRPNTTVGRGYIARRPRGDLGAFVDRAELVRLYIGDARRGDRPVAEPVFLDYHHAVSYAGVAVDIDVLHIHHGCAVDDHIVDHTRAAPTAPPRPVGKTGAPPPGNTRLTPAERHPADGGSSNADANAYTPMAEEGDQRRGVNRPYDRRSRNPAPITVDMCPTAIVIRRPAP